MIGFGSDGASVMRGKKNSVLTRLREKVPNIFDIHCIAHAAHLAASKAAKHIPKEIGFFIDKISVWFAHSPKE